MALHVAEEEHCCCVDLIQSHNKTSQTSLFYTTVGKKIFFLHLSLPTFLTKGSQMYADSDVELQMQVFPQTT